MLKKNGETLIGLMFILLSFTITSVPAYVYEQAQKVMEAICSLHSNEDLKEHFN